MALIFLSLIQLNEIDQYLLPKIELDKEGKDVTNNKPADPRVKIGEQILRRSRKRQNLAVIKSLVEDGQEGDIRMLFQKSLSVDPNERPSASDVVLALFEGEYTCFGEAIPENWEIKKWKFSFSIKDMHYQ